MLLVTFPDLSAAGERLVGEEDYLVAKVRMAGTNTAPYPRVAEPPGDTEWESMGSCTGWKTARLPSCGARPTGWACSSSRAYSQPSGSKTATGVVA